MRFVSIVGTRPQFIKLAPVSQALRQWHTEVIIHTGQHYDDHLSHTFFQELALPTPDYSLNIGSASHGIQTGRMLAAIEEVLIKEQPDGVIVFGDTNTTLAGALAASKLHIPVAHVESGLRSYNRAMPEEINRVLTDHISSRLFCPTENARMQAAREGLTQGVEVVGDVMYDVLLQLQPRLSEHARTLLPGLRVEQDQYIIATVHRPVNTDDPDALRRILQAFERCELPVLFPIHPRTRKMIQQYSIHCSDSIHLLDPLGLLDMLTLVQGARRVATDSGGLQKEAFLLATPCVTMREETEWPETLIGDWNVLVGNNSAAILQALHRPDPLSLREHPFGDGKAAQKIALSLCSWPSSAEPALANNPISNSIHVGLPVHPADLSANGQTTHSANGQTIHSLNRSMNG